ncbi:flagellar brake protein [Luteimonas sp. RC10]|uniref:flagellar brake protein n=1 Tax=Luteimonas sp. RC10 TaxID=2587035 RepID=UPI00161DFB22|nr:flagellar brake protein [Luteimonas sp. RC10]MBB3344427.1 c-di-GMP-binding flagellar brake protein YcgR [Luteimonas sp. RC10]
MTARTMAPADPLHPLDDEALSRYMLRDSADMGRVLRSLVETQALISGSLMPGDLSCPTALLAVGDDGTLVLDASRQDALNRRIATCTQIVCDTRLDAVQIRFRLSTPLPVLHEGRQAFIASWPEALLRLQRRDLYRVVPPLDAGVTLHPGHGDTPAASSDDGLRVLDLSGGGLAVAMDDGEDPRFTPGRTLDRCLLRLPDTAPIPVAVTVAHRFCEQTGPRVRWRAGCRFVALAPAAQRRILQSIFQIERQRNARLRRAV